MFEEADQYYIMLSPLIHEMILIIMVIAIFIQSTRIAPPPLSDIDKVQKHAHAWTEGVFALIRLYVVNLRDFHTIFSISVFPGIE